MRDGHHHILARNEVFILEIAGSFVDGGEARRRELFLDGGQFVPHDLLHPLPRAQDVEVIGNVGAQPIQFVADFVAAERRQAAQRQRQDGARLLVGQAERAVFADPVARIIDQRHQRRDITRRPVALHQLLARRGRIGSPSGSAR